MTALISALKKAIPDARVHTDPLRLLAYGTDASFYRLIPQVVTFVESEAEVQSLLAVCRSLEAPVTFRAAGTSLSGQAVSDSVLAVLGEGWETFEALDEGKRVRLGPGVIGGEANRKLAQFGRKIGPDPASINACKVGGIAANNASGMCCGVDQNSYKTLASLRVIMVDGTLLDTSDPDSKAAFEESHGDLLKGLSDLAADIQADHDLAHKIHRKFKIKNTMGYSLNALVDYSDPFDILAHLMIGSEGTLGFLSEIVYHTAPDPSHKASTLFFFENPVIAADAVARLKQTPVAAVELIDRAGLRASEGKPAMPDFLSELPGEATALLVEARGESQDELNEKTAAIMAVVPESDLLKPAEFTSDKVACEALWAMRKGLFPSIGAMRETGRTVIIEDVAFPVPDLAEGLRRLQALFEKHGYDDALIFGHALEGNLHFVFTQDFNHTEEVLRYEGLMADVAQLVAVDFEGSLKAEHGTGRNMAPFLETEWGPQAVAVMRKIKALFDPNGLLNPGVILNDDPEAHLKNLKPLPEAEPVVDKCIECGFCEHLCPSQGMTLTPRQRIVSWREASRRERAGEERGSFLKAFSYDGLDTCAACGLCSTACPVGINTGDLTRLLRGRKRGGLAKTIGQASANHYGKAMGATRLGLSAASLMQKVIGAGGVNALGAGLNKMGVPLWTSATPTASSWRPTVQSGEEPVIYIPSCANRAFGPGADDKDNEDLPVIIERLLKKAGYHPLYPENVSDLCCGQPFESKGLKDVSEQKAEEFHKAAQLLNPEGAIPVITDASPCAAKMQGFAKTGAVVMDVMDFLHESVLPRLELTPYDGPIAAHVTCSTAKMGQGPRFLTMARQLAKEVIVPEGVTCCGFAGDKGFTQPELNAHALRTLVDQIPQDCRFGVSSSRTCEIGLSHHGKIPYRSLAWLMDRQSD